MAYKSKGTIRVESIRSWTLIFVPDNDHSFKNGNKNYVVFVDWGNHFNHDGIDQDGRIGRIFGLNESVRGVKIILDPVFQGDPLAIQLLLSAVTKQKKVEITVEITVGAIRLIDIALPAA